MSDVPLWLVEIPRAAVSLLRSRLDKADPIHGLLDEIDRWVVDIRNDRVSDPHWISECEQMGAQTVLALAEQRIDFDEWGDELGA
jgi:hypothetical protein